MEHGPFIVDVPVNSMVMFHRFYGPVYQAGYPESFRCFLQDTFRPVHGVSAWFISEWRFGVFQTRHSNSQRDPQIMEF